MTTLDVQGVCKTYPTAAGASLEILDEVSFTLARGDNLAILGPSGSGKSTLLAIVGTLEPPTAGTVTLGSVDPFQLSAARLARFRSEQIGFVFQDHHLLPQCTVLENVLVPFLAEGKAGGEEVDRAEKLLARVGLSSRKLHRPAQLSGGEKQRVAIARALVREPLLVLADEPTGNLDQKTASEIADLLLELQQERDSMLIAVTHSEQLASKLSRRAQLVGGQLSEG